MAGVRGAKNPVPTKGGKPTGMFSSKGKQKNDGGGGHKDVLAYAKDCSKSMKRGGR